MRQPTRTSRKWIILSGVILVLVLFIFAFPRLIDINTYRDQFTRQLEQGLGRSVSLGAMKLSVFPSLVVDVTQAVIADDPQFQKGAFVQAESMKLNIGWWSLLTGDPQVRAIELTNPWVILIKEKGDRWNWSTLKMLAEEKPEKEAPPLDVTISNGRFTLIDRRRTPPTEQTYTGIDAAVENISTRTESDFELAITMPGEDKGRLEIEGTVGPIDLKQSSRSPIHARVKMDRVDLKGLEALFGEPSSRQGRLTLQADLEGKLSDGLKVEGDLKAEDLRFAEGAEASDIPLETKFTLTITAQEDATYALNIEPSDVKLGETEVRVNGQASHIPTQPVVDIQVKGDNVSLAGLLQSAHAFGFGPPKGTTAGGQADFDLRIKGPIKAFTLEGRSDIRDVVFRSRDLPEPIRVSQLALTFNPSAITVFPFHTKLGERTTVEIRALSIQDYSRRARMRLDVATENAKVEDLFKIAESVGFRPEFSGSGTASLTATVETDLQESGNPPIVKGQGSLSNVALTIPQSERFVEITSARLNFTGDSLRAEDLRARLAKSQVSGWLQVKNFLIPVLTFDLTCDQIEVARVQQLLAATQVAPQAMSSESKPEYSGIMPVVKAQPGSRDSGFSKMSADGRLAAGRVVYEDLVASNLSTQVRLQNQVLDLNPIDFGFYGGRYKGQTRLNLAGTEPDIGLTGGFNGVDINEFLSAASSLKGVIYGRGSGTIDVRGHGREYDAVVRSLTGDGTLAIADGKITSFDLEQQIAILGKLAGLPTGGTGTVFRDFRTNYRISNGRLTTDALRMELDQITVTGRGGLQLGAPAMCDYDLDARLSPALSKRVVPEGQIYTAVGGFFSEGDSIVVPLKMSGPITQPSFGLNTEVLQQRLKDRFLKRPDEAVKDILDIFKPKDKKKEKP